MKVGREKFVAKLRWPVVALIDHQSGVRVAATGSIGPIRKPFPFRRVPVLVIGIPMIVVRRLFDHAVHMWIEVRTIHSSKTSIGNNMK